MVSELCHDTGHCFLLRHGLTLRLFRVLKVVVMQLGVRVYRERAVAALAPLSGVLTVEQVEQVYGVARHRQAWSQVPPAAT
ncbi:hypothetical protein [Streptomyces sp. NPDC056785]|uniref:hypothetical protein n=1 Tax=Streptomyces sp. NPDC056785 TaxID=3345944 RepID=UPI00367F1672